MKKSMNKSIQEEQGPKTLLLDYEVMLEVLTASNSATSSLQQSQAHKTLLFQLRTYFNSAPSKNYTKEKVGVAMKELGKLDLLKGEVMTLINIKPSNRVQLEPLVEEAESRFGENGIDAILDILKEL